MPRPPACKHIGCSGLRAFGSSPTRLGSVSLLPLPAHMTGAVYIYIYIYICIIHTYIYIYIKRERERDIYIYTHTHTYVYIYIHT